MCDFQVTRIVNDILQSCTYVIDFKDKQGVYLVDCGDSRPIFDYLKRSKKIVKGVILTHCHYDHIYGLNDIITAFPDISVIASDKTFVGLENDDLNMAYLYTDEDYSVILNPKSKITITTEATISINDNKLYCILTPGHDVDCTTYVLNNCIFTGDSYNPSAEVFLKWHHSNVEQSVKSVEKIHSLIKNRNLNVYPGHYIGK